MSVLSTVVQSFSPLRIRNFRIYIIGQAISLIGTWLQSTAIGWVVWEISRSPATLGVVTMLGFLPQLIFGPFAGVMSGRRRRPDRAVAPPAFERCASTPMRYDIPLIHLSTMRKSSSERHDR